MKTFTTFLICLAAATATLGGCLPMTAQTTVPACPLRNLAGVQFYNGSPTSGTLIAPHDMGDNTVKWVFPDGGGVYMECNYNGAPQKLQLLPDVYEQCTAVYGGDMVTALTCRVRN